MGEQNMSDSSQVSEEIARVGSFPALDLEIVFQGLEAGVSPDLDLAAQATITKQIDGEGGSGFAIIMEDGTLVASLHKTDDMHSARSGEDNPPMKIDWNARFEGNVDALGGSLAGPPVRNLNEVIPEVIRDGKTSKSANDEMDKRLKMLQEGVKNPENALVDKLVKDKIVEQADIDKVAKLLKQIGDIPGDTPQKRKLLDEFNKVSNKIFLSIARETPQTGTYAQLKTDVAANLELVRKAIDKQLEQQGSNARIGKTTIAVDKTGHTWHGWPLYSKENIATEKNMTAMFPFQENLMSQEEFDKANPKPIEPKK
jgi:hypothetical protein